MRSFHLALRAAVAMLALAVLPGAPIAATLKLANQADALSMDPHSMQEAFQIAFLSNIYEPLVARGRSYALEPALATAWRATAPTVWRFELRQGVRFHDGGPFGADDVIFSLERTRAESSDTKLYAAPIREIRKVDAHTIDIVTHAPYPMLPDLLSGWLIMSRAWGERNNATVPQDVRKGRENFATANASGTGPFMLKERQPNVRTTLVPFPGWWGKPEHNLTEVVFTPIANDATRLAALVSGEVDMMEPAPQQDLDRLRAHPQLKVLQGPELRTVYLGLDLARDELLYSSVKGGNPLKDRRVRQALYQAIDIEAIRQKIMRGAAQPAGVLVAPGVSGWDAALDRRLPHDPAAARRLLAEAGYPAGLALGMHCPNDRYVNDAEICQAVAAMWARVGVKANLVVEPKSLYLPRALRREVTVYLLGWHPAANDAHNTLWALLNTPAPDGQGRFNLGGYSNPRVDELTRRIAVELDAGRRQALMREAWQLVNDDIPVLPLHNQALAWGVRRNVELVQQPDNSNPLRFAVVR